MMQVSELSLSFGKRVLFKDVNLIFNPGYCYGLIGANGSGKSTFLKILSGEISSSKGDVIIPPNKRMAVLKQDHFAFDKFKVLDTVIMGNKRLFDLIEERDVLYAKPDFSDKDGIRVSELEAEFSEMNGWEAESEAATLLNGLGISEEFHSLNMSELEGGQKVRVLLAQALFGNPDILLLDEPTNHLDIESIAWLENFIHRFENVVIVVSHDRHFLNQVCSYICDIDYGKIQQYVGNYDFWYQSSQIILKHKREDNRRKEDKVKELKEFISRFSANASKAKQATSRKKLLDKINIEDLGISSRKFPYISFSCSRPCGNVILKVENLSKVIDGVEVLKDFNMVVNGKDKIAFVGENDIAKTTLFQILNDEIKPDSGSITWGQTITYDYFPKENSRYFTEDINLVDWLRQFSKNKEEKFIRSLLGRMLFAGDEALKQVSVLSGGEKVRSMFSKLMLSESNVIILDQPLNHLDLESITALNNALIKFSEVVLFSCHDHQFIETVANRIIEITPKGVIDRSMTFEEYLQNDSVNKLRDKFYNVHQRVKI